MYEPIGVVPRIEGVVSLTGDAGMLSARGDAPQSAALKNQKPPECMIQGVWGRESGIRTRDTVSRIHTFQACSFNHSDTSLCLETQNTALFAF